MWSFVIFLPCLRPWSSHIHFLSSPSVVSYILFCLHMFWTLDKCVSECISVLYFHNTKKATYNVILDPWSKNLKPKINLLTYVSTWVTISNFCSSTLSSSKQNGDQKADLLEVNLSNLGKKTVADHWPMEVALKSLYTSVGLSGL